MVDVLLNFNLSYGFIMQFKRKMGISKTHMQRPTTKLNYLNFKTFLSRSLYYFYLEIR